mgnify:CR=1 FL=1
MIKNISSSEIKKFIEENSNVELLDVRTAQEWDNVGKPNGEKLGIKTHFITLERNPDGNISDKFFEQVKENIQQDKEILIICQAGGRSMLASQLLSNKNYKCINVSDGFEGNGVDPGWLSAGLPSVD